MTRYIFLLGFFALAFGLMSAASFAQSTSQEFPTAITSNEISGTIKARDLGDSRLTTYYYALSGDQGDLFINLVTRNFTGDIDVFTVSGLRPMAKIVVYADYTENETGRAIYLRKPERLLLRVQGRTPNDDPATFRLKFAGSFVAARSEDVPAEPELPKVNSDVRGSVRVNSVGTILPPPSKPVEAVAEKEKTEIAEPVKADDPDAPKAVESEKPAPVEEQKEQSPPAVVISDPLKSSQEPKSPRSRTASRRARKRAVEKTIAKMGSETPKEPIESEPEAAKPSTEPTAETAKPETEKTAESKTPSFRTLANSRKSRAAKKQPEPPKPDPLESINLIIQLKDGNTIAKKMSEVFKFSVDKGVLTVILKDGSISKYQIVNVAKVTIE